MAESSWPASTHNSGAVNAGAEYEMVGRYAMAGDGIAGVPSDPAIAYADGSARQVTIRANRFVTLWGRVWSSGTTDIIKAISANTSGSTRVDLLVLELARSSGAITNKIVAGTPGAGAPAITSNGSIHQYAVLEVTVPNNASVILAGNVKVVARLNRSVIRQVLLAGETWVKPINARGHLVQAQAGGGGSGGVPATSAGETALGAPGGGGGYCEKYFDSADITDTVVVTMGAAGAAGAAGTSPGGNAGNVTFGAYLTANGGGGGEGGDNTSGNFLAAGGSGGAASGGDINIPGGDGSNSQVHSGQALRGGLCGRSHLSGQGRITAVTTGAVGGVGANYGGGAGPAFNNGAGQAARAGAVGGAPIVIITTYF